MTIGASIFLMAVGAILRFAVNVSSTAISIRVVGDILMLAGGAGLVLGLFLWTTSASRRRASVGAPVRETRVETTQR